MTPWPLVAVFVGTDHHPFDRLLGWVRDLAADGGYDVWVQHGATRLPAGLRGSKMIGDVEMSLLLARAAAVVTHGGPGSIMDARTAGHRPVVVPRMHRLGEHVDDHQLRFARHLETTDTVFTAYDAAGFRSGIERAVEQRRSTDGSAGLVSSAVVDRLAALVEHLVRP